MTAQISDYCRYNSEEYAIIGKTDWFAFNPEVFGLVRGRCSTAVGKGYWAGYEIREDILFLNQLNICTNDGIYPEVRGVMAVDPGYNEYQLPDGKIYRSRKNLGCWIYNGLEFKFEYTGKFLLGTERLSGAKYCNYGGIDRFWKYRKLLSAEFREGKLVSIEDVSAIGKQVWSIIEENRTNDKYFGAIEEFQLEEKAMFWLENKPWWIKTDK